MAWLGAGTYAHRGLHDDATPENSSAAFAAAMARGLGIECDVRLTGDGRAIVFHDEYLGRLTDGDGAVADHDSQALARLKLPDGAAIPLLRDLLAQVAGGMPLLIEIKTRRDRPVDPLCTAVMADLTAYAGHHAIMSFDPRVGGWFARHAPATPRGLVMTEEQGRRPHQRIARHIALWRARPDFLACDIRDLPSPFTAAQRARGLPVLTWTVRTARQRQIADLHADAAIAEAEGLALPRRNP